MTNLIEYIGISNPIISPIIEDDYAVAMLLPEVPVPNAVGNLFAALSYQTWLLLLVAVLFVSTASLKQSKGRKRVNFDLCYHFLGQGVKSLGKNKF